MVLAIVIIFIYFIPAINAYSNKKNNRSSVLVINIFLGWTLIGWVVALAMSAGKDKEIPVIVQNKTTTAHELEKLAELKEKGIINQDEFEKQKQKILAK